LTALEDLLDTWPGSLVVVSHDRYLIERVTDTVVALLGDGQLAALPGGVEEYLARHPPPQLAPSRRRPAVSSAADARTARKEVARLERRLSRLETDEQRLLAELADHATDYQRVGALDERLRDVRAERSEAEDAWLHAAEAADS
jgi:ABC-type molybdate transport system ATPase subunit